MLDEKGDMGYGFCILGRKKQKRGWEWGHIRLTRIDRINRILPFLSCTSLLSFELSPFSAEQSCESEEGGREKKKG